MLGSTRLCVHAACLVLFLFFLFFCNAWQLKDLFIFNFYFSDKKLNCVSQKLIVSRSNIRVNKLHFCGSINLQCVSVSLQKLSCMCKNLRMNDGFTKLSRCFSNWKLKNVTLSHSKHSLCSHGNKLISDI